MNNSHRGAIWIATLERILVLMRVVHVQLHMGLLSTLSGTDFGGLPMMVECTRKRNEIMLMSSKECECEEQEMHKNVSSKKP